MQKVKMCNFVDFVEDINGSDPSRVEDINGSDHTVSNSLKLQFLSLYKKLVFL